MYKIANYEELYMPTDSRNRELVNATYVKVPAKPKGNGLERLLNFKDGDRVFAVWILLLESTTTQKKGTRGTLCNHKDDPATLKEVAAGILMHKKIKFVEYAIGVLVELGWVIDDLVRTKSVQGSLFSDPKSSVVKSNKEKGSVEKEFIAPTIKQISIYIQEKDLAVSAKRFLDWYTESEWMTTEGKPVKNWKLRLLSWDRNSEGNNKKHQQKPKTKIGPSYKEKYNKKIAELQAAGKYKPGMKIEV